MTGDVRWALRSLRLAPSFTLTAVVTLALGVGATTAIFSLVNAALVRPLPFHAPERLVQIWESKPSEGLNRHGVAPANFADWQARAQSFDGLALFDVTSARTVLGASTGSLQIRDASVTANFFSLLGVRPQVGRTFTASADAGSDELREVVIGDALWRRAFRAAPDIVGTRIRIEGRSAFVVVGVMPNGFSFPGETELWFAMTSQALRSSDRASRLSAAIGRLKGGVALADARADLETVAAQLAHDYPASNSGWTVAAIPLQEALVGHLQPALLALMGAVSLVLLVACANVTNLLLARGAGQQRELAIRGALGASRSRLVRQALIESLVLSTAAGALGCVLAVTVLPVLTRLAGEEIPRVAAPQINSAVLGFCALVTIGITLLTGLFPALTAGRRNVHDALRSDGERTAGGPGQWRLQHAFVAAQIGVTLVLIVGAVLLIRTSLHLRAIDRGFASDHVISMDIRVPFFGVQAPDRWYRLAEQSREVLARVRGIAGVDSAATTSDLPLSGRQLRATVTLRRGIQDLSGAYAAPSPMVLYHRVSPGYFATLTMPLVAGRDFNDADASNESQLASPKATPREGAAIVNETMARTFWPNQDPVGQYLSTGFDRRTTSARRVIGVVRDIRSESLRAPASPEVYVPYLEDPSFAFTLLVRTRLPLSAVAQTLRRELRTLDPDISAENVQTFDDIVTQSQGSSRFAFFVVSAFASGSILLSAVGLFGVLSVGIARRRREIAIRLALGATASNIQGLVMRRALAAVAGGIVMGAAGALLVTSVVASLLFGVTAQDPVSFALAALVLTTVALLASYLPARQVTRVQAAVALRAQ